MGSRKRPGEKESQNGKKFQLIMKNEKQKPLEQVELTMQEIWMATRPCVQKSKKSYTRKEKHKKDFLD